jgi:glycosyltransferase involved in cell wall biosynthesis
MDALLVSICCPTYNHAPFIKDYLDGFMDQQTDISIEILIHDDASTDGTDVIVREYTEKYPEIIFPIFEEENKYSRG